MRSEVNSEGEERGSVRGTRDRVREGGRKCGRHAVDRSGAVASLSPKASPRLV